MLPHPENDPKLNEVITSCGNEAVVGIKCQCGADTVINAAYAKYITGPLSSCAKCR